MIGNYLKHLLANVQYAHNKRNGEKCDIRLDGTVVAWWALGLFAIAFATLLLIGAARIVLQ